MEVRESIYIRSVHNSCLIFGVDLM